MEWGDSLSERAYLAIREKIFRGQVPLGGNLRRRDLAADLKMSLLPISQALQRLENEGLVESRPRVGTRVRIPSLREVTESYVVREALECQSARLFAEAALPEHRIELTRMAAHVEVLFSRLANDSDPDFLFTVHSYHLQFHMRIAEWCGCEALKKAIEKTQVLNFMWMIDVAGERRKLPVNFHSDLAAVLCGKDPAAADTAMRRHIRYGGAEMVAAIEKRDSAAKWRKPHRSRRSSSAAAASQP